MIDYDHHRNSHSPTSPAAVLPRLLAAHHPTSLLDVGCGRGTWLRAAQDLGIPVLCGLDGVALPPADLLASAAHFHHRDLTQPWTLGRRFDIALCLEVAEHLPTSAADTLIGCLTAHAPLVVFSAACPGQKGQHHVNCQWPAYWQARFNAHGFVCRDELRPQIWDDEHIEPWYRQNLFLAAHDPAAAGHEPRLQSVIHPAMLTSLEADESDILQGYRPALWYVRTVTSALTGKARRGLQRLFHPREAHA